MGVGGGGGRGAGGGGGGGRGARAGGGGGRVGRGGCGGLAIFGGGWVCWLAWRLNLGPARLGVFFFATTEGEAVRYCCIDTGGLKRLAGVCFFFFIVIHLLY
mgnify:CR=1 FL=1